MEETRIVNIDVEVDVIRAKEKAGFSIIKGTIGTRIGVELFKNSRDSECVREKGPREG